MNKQYLQLASIILILTLLSLSCTLTSTSLINISPETIAALTWSAMESKSELWPSSTPTPIPPSITPTPSPVSLKISSTSTSTYTPITPITAIPTDTPGPTPNQTQTYIVLTTHSSNGGSSTKTVAPPPCNAADFIAHVTIPNETILPPSTPFTKIWRIKNIGRCTWNTSYKFVFSSGDSMSGTKITLPKKVKPGETIDIEINMVSPASDGTYIGYWYLKDDDNVTFGYGKKLNDPFKVKIIVSANPQGTIFDFQKKYCTAEWKGNTKTLPCPGKMNSKNGFVIQYKKPILESGVVSDSALWTHPPFEKGAIIKGKYPSILIQAGDQFRSEIGCLAGNPKCDVTFQLYYKESNQEKQLIGAWNQVLDDSPEYLTIDLSMLSGKYVNFILSVTGNGKPEQNAAYWYHPEIYRP